MAENNAQTFCARLDDRCLLHVVGDDAQAFLQGLITSDMRKVSAKNMIYTCLLTPQGQFLHDFFVMQADAGQEYFLDCEKARCDDLISRLSIFKLRARVQIALATDKKNIYAVIGTPPTAVAGVYADPRYKPLGWRVYGADIVTDNASSSRYDDFCIRQGIPSGSKTAVPGKDFLSDVNLDLLQAVDWDKGCFTGQEVTARIHYRGLVKRRLFIVRGEGVRAGENVFWKGTEVGRIRQVSDSLPGWGLAVLKLAVCKEDKILLTTQAGRPISLEIPEYLDI